MDTAKNNNISCLTHCFLAKAERVSYKICNILNLRTGIVMSKNNCISFSFEFFDPFDKLCLPALDHLKFLE